MDRIELSIPGKIGFLPVATGAARRVCKAISKNIKISREFIYSVELVVSEAATNVLKHVVFESNDDYILSFEIHSDRLIISIRDRGPGFNLDTVPFPDFKMAQEGGYGLFVMQSEMDEVVCSRNNQWNILSMVKKF